jgi:hypothetical protein
MNPIIEQRLAQMQTEIDTLRLALSQFLSGAELDPQIARTLTTIITSNSSKLATSEDQAVNEAGVAVYNVLKSPDRFIRIGDNNVPAYD